MKTLKNDSRYILKKIIIGVGIALILAFINKNHVFAEQKEEINVGVFGFNCPIQTDTNPYYTTDYSFEIGNYNINLKHQDLKHDNKSYLSYISMVFSNSDGDYIVYTANSFNPFSVDNVITYFYDLSSLDITSSGFTFYDSNNNITQLSANHTIPFSQFFTYTTNSETNLDFQNLFSNYNFWQEDCSNATGIYANNFFVNGGVPTYSQYFNTLNYLLDNYTLVYSNIPISINGEEQIPSPVIPSSYSEINLTGSEGVYFVPKNYNQVPIEHIDSTDYIDFDYYYQGNIKEGWFPLNNIDKMFFSDLVFSSSSLELRDSFFPMYEDPNNTATGYNYYAYMIFNNSQENSTIYYNSQFFNAYKIEDFSTYKENICYYNRNDNETCLDIDFASSYNNSWLQGFGEDNSNFVGGQEQNQNKLDNLFSIIKVPFNFLNSLKNYQCSSITLPIPFTNQSMTIECLSGKFREVLGETLFNIIYTIITAFYAYRITIMNIDTATDILDPSDDKLEVVDL